MQSAGLPLHPELLIDHSGIWRYPNQYYIVGAVCKRSMAVFSRLPILVEAARGDAEGDAWRERCNAARRGFPAVAEQLPRVRGLGRQAPHGTLHRRPRRAVPAAAPGLPRASRQRRT